MKRINLHIIMAVFLVAMVAVSRVLNASMHMPNFVPVAAVGIFSGAVIKDKRALALLIPILGQFMADLYFQLFTSIQGFYDLTGQLFNYGAILCATGVGMTMKQPKALTTVTYLLGGSAVFFLVSNFGYFAAGWNGYTFAGLEKTYAMALPFYKNSLVSDMLGGLLLFGGYFVAQQALERKAQKVNA